MYPLLFIILSLATYIIASNHNDAVLLKNIEVLTLYKNQMTTGKRTAPVAQLMCVGGAAQHLAQEKVEIVQCYNKGFDGRSQAWECVTEIDKSLKLGQVTVSCEGYHYPDDPQVLVGSCALEYFLEFSGIQPTVTLAPPSKKIITTTTTTNTFIKPREVDIVNIIASFIFATLALITLFVSMFLLCCSPSETSSNRPIKIPSVTKTKYSYTAPVHESQTSPGLVQRSTTRSSTTSYYDENATLRTDGYLLKVPHEPIIQQTTIVNQSPPVQHTTFVTPIQPPRYDTVETKTTTTSVTESSPIFMPSLSSDKHISKSFGGSKGR